MNPGAFRMMCYCMLGCSNLDRAIRRLCEFHRVFFDRKLVMRLHREDGDARFETIVAPEAQLDEAHEPGAMMSAPWTSST